ncbi:MAG: hypothetical protein J2P57_13065 [Acidimicrobiaceae bacterium]|nr:hypothetical protein [Acidimicrobiaceae bacterium]
MLAADGGQCAGVDVRSGTMVRAWTTEALLVAPVLYDVVRVTVDADPEAVPDPSEPEAIAIAGIPEHVRRLGGRRAERLLKPLLHPHGYPLLGLHAPAVPFWERRPDHPSIALVEPEGPVMLLRNGAYLGCRFPWQGLERELPCLDRNVALELDQSRRTHAYIDKRDRLLVALTPPINGQCHKVVEAVVPRP